MTIMPVLNIIRRAPYLPIVAGLILFLSIWAARTSYSCTGDGCLGIIVPIGSSALLLLLQLFVCIPIFNYRSRSTNCDSSAYSLLWISASIACMVIPMLFIKWL
jgi:hypothetical protein